MRRCRGSAPVVRGAVAVTAWFETSEVAAGVFATCEPRVNSYFRAWCFSVPGRDADLQFDFGIGILPLRPALPLSGKPVIAVASHAHADHVGGFHEFETRLGHAAERAGFATMDDAFTLKSVFRDEVEGPAIARTTGAETGGPPSPEEFAIAAWDLVPAPLTETLAEGDRIDLGDRLFAVLHLPGHSPGGIGLFEEKTGLLLAGDAIYDDDLLDDIPGASIPDYLATMRRLLSLDCRLVLGGHGPAMTGARMQGIARDYIERRG